MTTWHRKSCKHPDVYPAGDGCYCSNCDTLAPLDQVVPDTKKFDPALPERPAEGDIHFTWPRSVQFWNGKNIHIGSTAPLEEKLGATEACQCYTKADELPRQIGSSASKLSAVYGTLGSTDQIRLLLLSKGSFNDPVHGTLVVARLSSNIEFQALSYTWADAAGDDSHSEVMFLGPRWDVFMVTANCKAALRRLRQEDQDCMVWVDAICIDQGNHSERNHQVGLMRRIYSAASEVFVYLGEASSLSKEAFQRIMWAKKHETIDEIGRQSLGDLFDMRYFHRVWVIQEIANAKSATIHHGGNAVGWSVLEEERLKTLAIHDSVPKWISSVYLNQEYTIRNLPDLLFSTTSSAASDPRDKVFALLGLISDAKEFDLVADYSLSLEEVHVGVSALIITNGDGCSILTNARGIDNGNNFRGIYRHFGSGIPSWVPFWDNRYRSTPIPRGSETFENYVVLRAKHFPHIFLSPILADLSMTKPRIHHVGGSLSILAFKMVDLSRVKGSWRSKPEEKDHGRIAEVFPGLAIIPDYTAMIDRDEILLLEGCETLFHVRREQKSDNTFGIIGVYNILLSMDQLNLDRSVNTSELDLLSHFIMQSCPLERKHLQRMIELETLLKHLGRWDTENYASPDIIICEAMFSDNVIERALSNHIKKIDTIFSPSENQNANLEELRPESQDFLPNSLQVQWLTTRLGFWDREPTWEIVDVFRVKYSEWRGWNNAKMWLENFLLATFKGSNSIERFKLSTVHYLDSLAPLTIRLTSRSSWVASRSYPNECRVRIGSEEFLLFQATDSVSPSAGNLKDAISGLFEKNFFDCRSSTENSFPGFRKMDDGSFEFVDWDWSKLEAIFEPLEPFYSSATEDLQKACSSRISLCKLQPRGREWERITLI